MKNNELAISLADVMELMLDSVCVVDRNGSFVFVSAAFENMFGYAPHEVIGKPMVDMVYPDDREKTLGIAESVICGKVLPRFENRWVRKDGKVVNVLWSARWSEEHQVRIAVAHDITERKEIEAQLLYAAGHDDLTDLPNRTLLLDRLQASLTLAEREQVGLSVLFIDIDGFKDINDGYGHAVGDLLLQQIAKRLGACVRKSDTVGRLGGDEFLIILNKVNNTEGAALVAEKIRAALSEVFVVDGSTLSVSASIGIASYPENGKEPLDLVQSADHAMYQAKNNGGDKVILAAS
ncbi:PAS domain S-box-containing protein/diguanylate cyclase (GGDEF) domain-containing protein [Marinomonas polaris DSM 16579]|uniref:PAS domain S-box-containing protein/diguanylate cyclase (GGDEF) domain-containing protein n=1 Tax=Marinomonas polaris DSM 16579 TaxID=1122206 RepID=A0A1M4T6D0_9GAMM|nr:diguanylate cyclase [Marinomonas polaris]SHE39868.1 PAS domain S-box-containing protein/diguanylate cyclase (GGDEF) domain-containing protein [Marinomonas polaris DSM 16579]